MLRAGLDLDGELLALACAGAHSGEPNHLEGARSILKQGRADRGRLADAADYPLDDAERALQLREGKDRSPIAMNCSGKHAAMLATCRRTAGGRRRLSRARPPVAASDPHDPRGPHRGPR